MVDLLDSWLAIFVSLATLTGFAGSALVMGWRLGRASALRDEKRALLKERLERIYAPIRVCLLDTHITTVEAVRYGYLSQRLKRFGDSLKTLRPRQAIRRLFDRGMTSSSGVEFGSFPLKNISRIVSQNSEVADPALLNLVQAARRSMYEYAMSDSDTLTQEELALAEHIWQEHERLSKKLGRGA